MERGGILRWLLLGVGIFFLVTFLPKLFGKGNSPRQPAALTLDVLAQPDQSQPHTCSISNDRIRAHFSTRGASLTSLELLKPKYRKAGAPIDLVTTPDHPQLNPLYVDFRNPAAKPKDNGDWLVDYDVLSWKITKNTARVCEFSYQGDKVEIKKRIEATKEPYQLALTTSVKNTAASPKRLAVTINTTDFRRDKDIANRMFRMNPMNTHVECVDPKGKANRLRTQDFEPDDFKNAERFHKTDINDGYWFEPKSSASVAAASNAYFTNALATVSSPGKKGPFCQVQIMELWDAKYGKKSADPNAAALYRARLAYPKMDLAAGKSATYKVISYLGPKERDALATSGHNLDQLIDLGFFAAVAKVLVAFLLWVHGWVKNWGIAIIVLTVTARVLLFPLSVPSVKSMIKMRELKPEIDKLNEKFKDDPQGKGLAQMELWKKHKVNPLKGCLPQLAAMPVWFALYTTLQTAVELYNIPFLWFPDLSQPDPLYLLPFIIGAIYFLQQKLMPTQMDPTQQKMMMYFMPGMFTVFMLFLPSGLGVYMFTNSLLGILQQQAVERLVKRSSGPGGDRQNPSVIDTEGETVETKRPAKGKKRRRKGKSGSSDAKLTGAHS